MPRLIRKDTGEEVTEEFTTTARGDTEKVKVTGYSAPHKLGSTGRVFVRDENGVTEGFFPSVFGLEIVDHGYSGKFVPLKEKKEGVFKEVTMIKGVAMPKDIDVPGVFHLRIVLHAGQSLDIVTPSGALNVEHTLDTFQVVQEDGIVLYDTQMEDPENPGGPRTWVRRTPVSEEFLRRVAEGGE